MTSNREQNVEHVMLCGKLPFSLLLEDSLDENNIPIVDKTLEIFNEDGSIMAGFFQKRVVNEYSGVIASEDIHGELSYTKFCIILHNEYIIGTNLNEIIAKDNPKDHFDNLIDLTVFFVNKFLDAYRFCRNHEKDRVPFVNKVRISPWIIISRGKDKKIIEGMSIRYLDYRGTGQMLGKTPSKDQLTIIKKLCNNNDVVDLPGYYLQQVNRNRSLGEFNLAILFFAFYIEARTAREVRYLAEKKNRDQSKLDNILFMNIKQNRYNSWIDMITKLHGDKSRTNNNRYKDYEKDIIGLRDDIVHAKKYIIITEKHSEKAAKITMTLRNELLKAYFL